MKASETTSQDAAAKPSRGPRRFAEFLVSESALGLFFVFGAIALFAMFEFVSAGNFTREGRQIHGYFENIQELKPGAAVKMAGVNIGLVKSFGFETVTGVDPDRVKVTMVIDPDAPVKTDSTATIKFTGLMGQNFVDISFGSSGSAALVHDAVIQTAAQPDLATIMAKLENVATGVENVTKTFSGDSIQNLMGPLTDFMKENNPKLSVILDNLKVTTTQIAAGEGTIGKLITDETLYTSTVGTVQKLQGTADELEGTITEARGVFSDVKVTLEKARTALDNADGMLVEAKGTITDLRAGKGTLGRLATDDTLYTETATAMTNLREILVKINTGQGSIGGLVNDAALLKNVKMTLQKVDKATESLEDQGPLSILGTAVNSLF